MICWTNTQIRTYKGADIPQRTVYVNTYSCHNPKYYLFVKGAPGYQKAFVLLVWSIFINSISVTSMYQFIIHKIQGSELESPHKKQWKLLHNYYIWVNIQDNLIQQMITIPIPLRLIISICNIAMNMVQKRLYSEIKTTLHILPWLMSYGVFIVDIYCVMINIDCNLPSNPLVCIKPLFDYEQTGRTTKIWLGHIPKQPKISMVNVWCMTIE